MLLQEERDIILKHRDELLTRDKNANKGTYGRLLIIAGSKGMAGAAYLSGISAFKTGVGMVKYLGPEENRVILQTLLPEAMYESNREKLGESLEWADYLIIGPGLSKGEEARSLIKELFAEPAASIIRKKKLTVLDADALNLIAEENLDPGTLSADRDQSKSGSSIVITPHIVEMQRLSNVPAALIKENPEKTASDYAKVHHVNVVLKDAKTAVAVLYSDETASLKRTASADIVGTRILDYGSPAMAKAGSGDVLCGFLIGTTAMLKGNSIDAIPIAVMLHGMSGCIASEKTGCHSILASDIAKAAPKAIKRIVSDV